jgi:hypothetical protein
MSAPAVLLLAALAPLLDAPPGRPPEGPLQRYEPRIYDLRYDVTISSAIPYGQDDPRLNRDPRVENPPMQFGTTFVLHDAPIAMPIIYQGTYSRIDNASLAAELYLADRLDPGLPGRMRVDGGFPHHTHAAILPVVHFEGQTLRFQVGWRMQVWSSRIDDGAAAKLAWPREWPAEVKDGLAPQLYVESDDEIFAQTVERITEGKLRLVPPYLAAKDIVRYCVNELQLTGGPLLRGRMGILHGLDVKGAAEAARTGMGNANDLVCLCVAMLRAAGIPARPVIGVMEENEADGDKVLVTWAEFYLAQAGWVPFDPEAMRGSIRSRDVRTPWPEFGSMEDLDRRLPLAYHFVPRGTQSPQAPAAWGWDPRPGGSPNVEQRILIGIVSRGRGVEDERVDR